MAALTITEALAELSLIDKKVNKKQESVNSFLFRQDMFKDPLADQGGSKAHVSSEQQAISDLLDRKLRLRRAIADKNTSEKLTISGVTMSIADWLVWRREIAPLKQQILASMLTRVQAARTEAAKRFGPSEDGKTRPTDIVVNFDERQAMAESERIGDTLGILDGQLSLKNATVTLDV